MKIVTEEGYDFSNLFDAQGNIPNFKDPYRSDREKDEVHSVIFDEEGYLESNFYQWLRLYLKTRDTWALDCTAAQLYHAEEFANGTKGNYPTIYYWR